MSKNRRLIKLMITSSIVAGLTVMSGCSKSETEKQAEEQIRQLLEYDANINIEKYNIEQWGFELLTEIKNKEYFITFKSQQYVGRMLFDAEVITYSVDKDTYYYFRNNYNLTETSDEVNMVNELVMNYDPIKVISSGEEMTNSL